MLAHFIISAACNKDRTVAGQVAHGMTESRGRRLTLGFDSGELTMHNFAVNDDWLEVAQLVL